MVTRKHKLIPLITCLLLLHLCSAFAIDTFAVTQNKQDSSATDTTKTIKEIRLVLSFPSLNFLYSRNYAGYGFDFTFISFAAGLEYKLTPSTFLSFKAGTLTSLKLFSFPPYPLAHTPPDQDGNVSHYFNLRIHTKVNDFTYGGGVMYQIYNYHKDTYCHWSDQDCQPEIHKHITTRGIGLSSSLTYTADYPGSIGVFYQPMLFNLTEHRVEYQAHIGIEISLTVRLF